MEKKRKSGGIRKKLLCWILAVATVLTGAQIPAVSQAMGTTEMVEAAALKKGDPVKVRFTSSTGKVYSTLQIATKMGEKITLPLVPGYKTLKNAEWELDENFAFRAGESLTLAAGEDWDDYIVKGVLTFRAKKYYNVSFYNSSGSSNSAMRALEKTLEKGARFRLPYVPAVQGYAVLGWSTRKGASTPMYSERQAITVKKNMKFYAVRKKLLRIRLHSATTAEQVPVLHINL